MALLARCNCSRSTLTRRNTPQHIHPREYFSLIQPRPVACRAGKDAEPDDEPPKTAVNQLEIAIKRKAKEIEVQLKELGEEGIEDRMKSSVQVPSRPAYRLTSLVAETVPLGRPVLILEVARPTPDTPLEEVANLAKLYVQCGADALAVSTDSYVTPEGLKDLWTVIQAVKVPVLMRDWIIHPLQIVFAKEAGAAGVIGVINQVNGRGTAVLSSFSAAIGLDAPVEVVNTQEVDVLAKLGVPFYGVNLGVGLSVAIPGFSNMIAHGLLGDLPQGAICMVGVRSMEEARRAKYSGADALFIKQEMLNAPPQRLRQIMTQLEYIVSGDD